MIHQGHSIEAGAASIAVFEIRRCQPFDWYLCGSCSVQMWGDGIVGMSSQAKSGRMALTHSEYDVSSGEMHYGGCRPA